MLCHHLAAASFAFDRDHSASAMSTGIAPLLFELALVQRNVRSKDVYTSISASPPSYFLALAVVAISAIMQVLVPAFNRM